MFKRVNFIVETEQGDTFGFSLLIHETISEKEMWMLAVVRGYEYLRRNDKIARIEFESEEEASKW